MLLNIESALVHVALVLDQVMKSGQNLGDCGHYSGEKYFHDLVHDVCWVVLITFLEE